MTSFTQEDIALAKENAFLHGVREEVSDGVATSFLFWWGLRDCPSRTQVRNYWGEFYTLAY